MHKTFSGLDTTPKHNSDMNTIHTMSCKRRLVYRAISHALILNALLNHPIVCAR